MLGDPKKVGPPLPEATGKLLAEMAQMQKCRGCEAQTAGNKWNLNFPSCPDNTGRGHVGW